jgi:acyl carrier protein
VDPVDDIEQAVMAAVVATAKAQTDGIGPQSSFRDLGIDSLEFIVVVQAVEEALGILLPDEQTAIASTVGDLIEISRVARTKV